ncbi:uncharacterized protein LOC143264373 [Megachile rotundata]|uniref:uncharacterized protein LOC143264373 n=1 Tax=Megachile rotundata TaxID=143995 RepID=UPI003FD085B7
MREAVQACSPSRSLGPRKRHVVPAPWWDKECDKMLRLRKASLKKWKHTLRLEDWFAYKKQAACTKRTLREIDIAVSKIAPPWAPELPLTIPPDNSGTFLNAPFTLLELNYSIDCLREGSSPGPDCIDNTMIFKLPVKTRLILLDILNDLYSNNLIPAEWLSSHLHFIPKQGGKGLRPISLTSCICKLFERMVKLRLQWWCETSNILPDSQAGFRKARSCQDNIGSIILEANKSFMLDECTVVAFLDISAAFDSVHINTLIGKLADLGLAGNILHFISNRIRKGLAAKLERLQIQAAKLALGLRFSSPNNVALAEARLPPLRVRAEFLGSKYFLKVFSFSNNPICSYLEKFTELWNASYGGSSDRRKRGEVIHSCLAYSLPLKDHLYTLHRASCHLSDLDTQFSEINVNTSFGLHLQSSPSANLEFASFISENFPNHILIFTDGSKSDDSPSTGVAFVCAQLNKKFALSLNPHASIYTAECAAISFAIDMAKENKDLSYLICSDSLSALQSLHVKPYTASTNPFIVRIKESLKTFNCDSNSDSSISFLWIPSHQNIEGNELADKAAKEAAQNPPSSHIFIPYTDFNSILRRRLWEQASEAWLKDSNRKGSHYFNTYFDSSKHPWFHNLCISRFVSSWVSRYRSNHYNFGVSLKKIGVDSSSNCPCGFVDRDLNHVI